MKSIFIILLTSLVLVVSPAFAQTRQIKNLRNQKAQLERDIKQNQTRLAKTRQQKVKKEQTVDFIEDQLQIRLGYINELNVEIDSLGRDVERLEQELKQLEEQVNVRKRKYVMSLRQARNSQSLRNPLLFIFSAESFPQIYRRMRYAREFAALQKTLGIQLMDKQIVARDKRNELLGVKQQRSELVQEVVQQRRQLASKFSVVKANVAQLQRRQKEMEREVAAQQKQLNALTKKIDQLVAYEVEQARKRAEEEARRKREAELAKAKKNGKSTPATNTPSTSPSKAPSKWLTTEDQKLNGNLEQNKGRLPVPLTGPYRVARRFGMTQVAAGVMLDNKGTNYMGQAGARARAIFDGEVSAVFQLGSLKNVLVRHGSYISVYCNLSSTIVQRGQKVKARDILGTVADDGQGNYILHFQLRKETAKLNPESWIGR